MKNRAGKTVQNLTGEAAYYSYYPQPPGPGRLRSFFGWFVVFLTS